MMTRAAQGPRSRLGGPVWVALLALSCSGPEPAGPGDHPVPGERTPLGVANKPLVETPTGVAIADELLVRFADAVAPAEIERALSGVAGERLYEGPGTGYTVVRFAEPAAAAGAARALADLPVVRDVGWNHVMIGSGLGTSPTEELTRLQWNLHAMTLAPLAHRPSAAGVTIAVLDTGVAYEDHADALGAYRLAPDLVGVDFAAGWDFINDDAHPNDDQRHGTHVTGVMVARSGIASIAPDATILPIKVLDHANSGTELALAEGLHFAADRGARVANLSLTFPPTYFPSRVLQAAVDHAHAEGLILVAAAGNHAEPVVTYPAAFRDVIAVGASDLPADYVAAGEEPWADALGSLRAASYSNHSYKLDVLAPAGALDGDADGDGLPEAVLAQTFALGDPTSFAYFFYAGTSQACAEVSALVALLVAERPGLDAFQARALLVENARALDAELLSPVAGRGAVQARKTLAHARQRQADRPRLFADVIVSLHDLPGGPVARAHVEIVDEAGAPAPGVTVHGLFTGAAYEMVTGVTDRAGVATFTSRPLEGNLVVAFQVEAVVAGRGGRVEVFDRPRGFVRIDSLSLELLAIFGAGLGAAPSGTEDEEPTGAASGAAPSGAGLGTSPTIPLPSDPTFTPISIAFDPALFAGTNYRPTLLLPNFSWGLATSPMAVAADEAWFLSTFPNAARRRVVSLGRGLGASPFLFTAGSFPRPILVPPNGIRIPLLLPTFLSGLGTSPTGMPAGEAGVGGEAAPAMWVDRTYGELDGERARRIEELIGSWVLAAAGLGASPTYDGSVPLGTFLHVASFVQAYVRFAPLAAAAPAASYGDALGAAGMPVAPVPADADGEGIGVSALP